MSADGLEAVFLANREVLLRFLRARGAGEGAEDLLQELWVRIHEAGSRGLGGPVAQPLSYLYRAADNLMRDRYRSQRQSTLRDQSWSEAHAATLPGVSDEPSGERVLIARERLRRAVAAIDTLGPRAAAIFRRHRVDGVTQRVIASEMGVSISTVESDLRTAYRALANLDGGDDEA
jgi:RNA polymerase sigma factor (sigma-70 family)